MAGSRITEKRLYKKGMEIYPVMEAIAQESIHW
jgi:hypothetical protein